MGLHGVAAALAVAEGLGSLWPRLRGNFGAMRILDFGRARGGG